MKYDTSRFGTLVLPDDKIIHFPDGLYGFEGEKKFALLPFDPNIESPMEWLQSLKTPGLAFVVTDPFLFVPNYKVVTTVDERQRLKMNERSEVKIRAIVTIPEVYTEMTANLVAPLVINTDAMIARQVVLTTLEYDTRQFLLPESSRQSKANAAN